VAEKDKKEAGKKEAPAKEAPAEKPKKRIPSFLLVAVGAVLGGAGVVVALPPKKVEPPAAKKPSPVIQVQHPDLMEYVFNPRTEAGKAAASISFYFVYEVSEDLEAKAFEQIKANWDRARSNCVTLLTGRMVKDMNTDSGKAMLAKDLIVELDAALFPAKPEKIARVSEVLWAKILFQ
jgi:flagellar basal body-associated protein FliL